jgi:undecaprenyl-diphosphatase
MIHILSEFDHTLFLFFNGLHNSFWDICMSWITNKFTWFPFYFILIVWLIVRYKTRGIVIILMAALVIVLSDQVTSSFMKPFFHRLRPCHDPTIMNTVHLVASCGGLYGFCSSHAANSFGLVMIIFLIISKDYPWTTYLFFWAGLVSYSRVYVGVHFPGDVAAGALIGCIFALLVYFIYKRLPGRWKINHA